MSGSHWCIPRNESEQPPYFQNRIIMFCFSIPALIYLWEIYIFPGLVCLFCCSQICGPILGIYKSLTDTKCGNWDWGRAIPRKWYINGIFVAVQKAVNSTYFLCSVPSSSCSRVQGPDPHRSPRRRPSDCTHPLPHNQTPPYPARHVINLFGITNKTMRRHDSIVAKDSFF